MNTLSDDKKIIPTSTPAGRESGVPYQERYLDETLDASFPASDPPNWTLGVRTRLPSAGRNNTKKTRIADAPCEKPPEASDIALRSNKGCVEFPDWMNEGSLCTAAPEVSLYGIRVKLPIFPT